MRRPFAGDRRTRPYRHTSQSMHLACCTGFVSGIPTPLASVRLRHHSPGQSPETARLFRPPPLPLVGRSGGQTPGGCLLEPERRNRKPAQPGSHCFEHTGHSDEETHSSRPVSLIAARWIAPPTTPSALHQGTYLSDVMLILAWSGLAAGAKVPDSLRSCTVPALEASECGLLPQCYQLFSGVDTPRDEALRNRPRSPVAQSLNPQDRP